MNSQQYLNSTVTRQSTKLYTQLLETTKAIYNVTHTHTTQPLETYLRPPQPPNDSLRDKQIDHTTSDR